MNNGNHSDTLLSIRDRLRLIASDMCGSNRFYLNEEIGRLEVAIKCMQFVPPIQTVPLHPEPKAGESIEVRTVQEGKRKRWRKRK
jgi:hypothetical protein